MKQIANHRPTATPRLRADGNKYFPATRGPRPPINFILAPASRDLGPIIGRSDNKVPVSTIHSSTSDQIKRPNLEDWWSQSRDPARNCHWPFSRHVTGTVTLKFDLFKNGNHRQHEPQSENDRLSCCWCTGSDRMDNCHQTAHPVHEKLFKGNNTTDMSCTSSPL
jgi:hypothetical protein